MDVTDDNANETTETVVANVAAATSGQYTVAPGAGTATVALADNDPSNNGDNGRRTRARPSFSGAQVFGNQMFLFGPDGEVKAVVPVTPGTQVAFSDLTGDGNGDVLMISPQMAVLVDGQTGNFLAVMADFDGDRVADLLLFAPDTGSPRSVFLSRPGQVFSFS